MKFFSRGGDESTIPDNESHAADQAINSLLATHVRPMLKRAGFAKYGMSFYRTRGDIIDVINFQKSKSNTPENQSFYINCGLDSTIFQLETSGKQNLKPKEYDCLFRQRLDRHSSGSEQYMVSVEGTVTDLDRLSAELQANLHRLLTLYASIVTTENLLDLAIKRNGLQNYEEICYYLAQHKDIKRLHHYITGLHDVLESDDRWPNFADAIYASISEYTSDKSIAKLLEAHAPPSFTPIRFKPPTQQSA